MGYLRTKILHMSSWMKSSRKKYPSQKKKQFIEVLGPIIAVFNIIVACRVRVKKYPSLEKKTFHRGPSYICSFHF